MHAGEQSLGSFSFRTERKWIWFAVLYMLSFQVVVTGVMCIVLHLVHPATRTPSVPDQEALAAYRKVRCCFGTLPAAISALLVSKRLDLKVKLTEATSGSVTAFQYTLVHWPSFVRTPNI